MEPTDNSSGRTKDTAGASKESPQPPTEQGASSSSQPRGIAQCGPSTTDEQPTTELGAQRTPILISLCSPGPAWAEGNSIKPLAAARARAERLLRSAQQPGQPARRNRHGARRQPSHPSHAPRAAHGHQAAPVAATRPRPRHGSAACHIEQ